MGSPGSGSSRRPNGGQRLHEDFDQGRCQSPGGRTLPLENGKLRGACAIAPVTGNQLAGTVRKRRSYKWTKEARDLVRAHALEGGDRHKLITKLGRMTGFPRRVCVRFAGQMGIEGDRSYREWSEHEIASIKQLHKTRTPRQLAARLKRPESSVRAMMRRLGISLRVEKDRFTKYTLALLLHVRPEVVQDWIDKRWLKMHREGTEKLPRLIIKAADFIEFCKRHPDAILGRRVNMARLEFIQEFVFLSAARHHKRVRGSRQRRIGAGQVLPHLPATPKGQISSGDAFKPTGSKIARSKAARAS